MYSSSGLLVGGFGDDRRRPSLELSWKDLRVGLGSLLPPPSASPGASFSRGLKDWVKFRKKEEVLLAVLGVPLVFGALAFWSIRFTF